MKSSLALDIKRIITQPKSTGGAQPMFETPMQGLRVNGNRVEAAGDSERGTFLGPALVATTVTEGTHFFKLKVECGQAGFVFVGIADAAIPLVSDIGNGTTRSAVGGEAYGYHVGSGKMIKSPNSHHVSTSAGKRLYPTAPKSKAQTTVNLIINMTERSLSIGVDDQVARMTSVKVPDAVRPWVWLRWGGDSVTLIEHGRLDQPKRSALAVLNSLVPSPNKKTIIHIPPPPPMAHDQTNWSDSPQSASPAFTDRDSSAEVSATRSTAEVLQASARAKAQKMDAAIQLGIPIQLI